MDVDLPRPEDEKDRSSEERKEVARVRVMDRARGSGEMTGWLHCQADDEAGRVRPAGDRLPSGEEEYLPDLGAWLAERSGVARLSWAAMLVSEDVWKAVITRFLSSGRPRRRPPFGRLRVSGTWPLPSGLSFVLSLSKHEREWTTIKWNPYNPLASDGEGYYYSSAEGFRMEKI